jgi:CoA:oxalate CoA-transferase
MKKLGFDWEHIQKINPSAVYCSICGFGHDTLPENASRPAYDMVAQAYSGIMSITGPEGGPPCRVGSSIGDILAGHQAVIGILAALVYREKTGRGQYLDISMVDGLFSILENAVTRVMNAGETPEPLGSTHPAITPFQGFRARDGAWIIAAVGNDNLWAKFCTVLDRKDLTDDPRFSSNQLRTENRKELIPILQEEMDKRTAKEWGVIFEEEGIPYSPINTVKEICKDPHIAHREMLVEIDQPLVGKMKICGSPFRLSETPGNVYSPAPMLGEHSDQVLRELLGYSQEKIDRLKSEGIINPTV